MAASLPAEPHIALLQCPVVYLGRAAPANVPDGLEAVQKPLLELYHPASMQDAIDAMLTVYTSGVQAQSPNGSDKWWPIQDLMKCGAFKPAADGPLPFVPLMSGESARCASGQTPTLFAMTFRRRDIPAANTWVFIVESDGSALSLVQALSAAHENTAGWSSPTDRPPIAAPAVESANATHVHCHSKVRVYYVAVATGHETINQLKKIGVDLISQCAIRSDGSVPNDSNNDNDVKCNSKIILSAELNSTASKRQGQWSAGNHLIIRWSNSCSTTL
jgi:hypothetical protein